MVSLSRTPRRLVTAAVAVALAVLPARAAAQVLTILASPSTPLSVSTATAGFQPDASAEDATTGYQAVVLLGTTKRIVASLSSPLPAGVTLKVKLQATSGASGSTSAGYVDLDVVDKTVLSTLAGGLTGATFIGSITYQMVCTVAASPFTNTVDVVFTLTDP